MIHLKKFRYDQCRLVPMGCRAAVPHAFLDLFFFRTFNNVNIFYNVIVHTLFPNAPVYVAEKTNFPILLALNLVNVRYRDSM